jgi:hypothetical protein
VAAWQNDQAHVPNVGHRVEVRRGDKTLHGTVEYAEGENVLVRWDEGGASTLRLDSNSPRK